MIQLPVVADFPYDRIHSWRDGNPFCIAFCYASPRYTHNQHPRHGHSNFIIKGGVGDVDLEIKKRHIPMLIFRTLWWRGTSRTMGPSLKNFEHYTPNGASPFVHRLQPWRIIPGPHFYRRYQLRYQNQVYCEMRRFPRKWLPEFDRILDNQPPKMI